MGEMSSTFLPQRNVNVNQIDQYAESSRLPLYFTFLLNCNGIDTQSYFLRFCYILTREISAIIVQIVNIVNLRPSNRNVHI